MCKIAIRRAPVYVTHKQTDGQTDGQTQPIRVLSLAGRIYVVIVVMRQSRERAFASQARPGTAAELHDGGGAGDERSRLTSATAAKLSRNTRRIESRTEPSRLFYIFIYPFGAARSRFRANLLHMQLHLSERNATRAYRFGSHSKFTTRAACAL